MLDWILYTILFFLCLILGARKLKRWLTFVPDRKEELENKN